MIVFQYLIERTQQHHKMKTFISMHAPAFRVEHYLPNALNKILLQMLNRSE